MKTKDQRYNELYSSGLVDSIKNIFSNRKDISEDYYVLMADYIDSMNEIKDQMLINPTEIARKMPELVKSIQETNLRGIYGRTDDNRIQIEQNLSYDDKKLYFFHELTHALQTSHEEGREQCGFYNGHDGMFLTEGATQYTAEMLYNVSNGTKLQHKEQPRTVRGSNDRIPYSPLSEYQYNGNVLELLAKSMDLPLPQILALAYKKDGRETLKELYESMEGNQGKFDELMNNLEQIYSIDNLLIHGYGEQLQSQTPINITMQDGVTRFQGNLNTYKELMNKTERELIASYMENHNTEEILQNYDSIVQFLTTAELKNNFLVAVHELEQDLSQRSSRNDIIEQEQSKEDIQQQNENKMTLKQKVARFLQKNNLFINLSFVDKFVHQQLNVLPSATQETRNVKPTKNETRENFINKLTNFGEYRNLSPIQRLSEPQAMFDPQKTEEMRRKREGNQKYNEGNER